MAILSCLLHSVPPVFSDKVDESWEYSLRDALYTACKTGDIQSLRSLLQLPEDQEEDKDGERKTGTGQRL